MWVSPFRYLRIMAYLQLPEAFRSLSRLSSALSAKASALRSYSLNQAFRYFFQYPEYSRLAYRLYTSSLICLQISFFRCLFQMFSFQGTIFRSAGFFPPAMGTSGLEPPTSRLSGVRSNLLSYAPSQDSSSLFI